jgi:hypothetical protein
VPVGIDDLHALLQRSIGGIPLPGGLYVTLR